jgi:hypothetical protein
MGGGARARRRAAPPVRSSPLRYLLTLAEKVVTPAEESQGCRELAGTRGQKMEVVYASAVVVVVEVGCCWFSS